MTNHASLAVSSIANTNCFPGGGGGGRDTTALSTMAHDQALDGVSMVDAYQAQVPFIVPPDFAKKMEVRGKGGRNH